MIELTPTAQSRLDTYLHELRRVLSGSRSVDPADVERDVRDHIDAALVGSTPPVEVPALNDVLRELGSPTQWLPDTESRPRTMSPAKWLSGVRQSFVQVGWRLARGPESYRLAYVSFVVLVAGFSLSLLTKFGGPLLVAIPVSFVLSRAALSLFTPERLTGGQKWLLYPSLAAMYVVFLVVIVAAPIVLHGVLMDSLNYRRGGVSYAEVNAVYCAILSSICLCAGVLCAVFPGAIRSIFYPFAGWFGRRLGIGLTIVGLAGFLVVGTLLFTVGLPDRSPDRSLRADHKLPPRSVRGWP